MCLCQKVCLIASVDVGQQSNAHLPMDDDNDDEQENDDCFVDADDFMLVRRFSRRFRFRSISLLIILSSFFRLTVNK